LTAAVEAEPIGGRATAQAGCNTINEMQPDRELL
jgi:hypothetical protein